MSGSGAIPAFPSLQNSLGDRRLTMEPPPQYPMAIISATNRCNLSCTHCFTFRDGNPNDPTGEMNPEAILAEAERLRDRHGIVWAVWMGGEPMIRWRMLEQGVRLFQRNTIATNGTIPLKNFGPNVTYTLSLDGPRDLNDALRGAGVFDRALEVVAALPDPFESTLMVQCVVHRQNQHRLEEMIRELEPTNVEGITFTFLVPEAGEVSPRAWESVEERETAIDIVWDLKRRYPDFVWNSGRSLELLRPGPAKLITDNCPLLQVALPLYLDGDRFSSPLCCYGNDVDCDRCGSWGVFSTASKFAGPWDELVPPDPNQPPFPSYADAVVK